MLDAIIQMESLRRRLSWIVGAWLVYQAAVACVAPASLVAAGMSAELCTCPGGMPGDICPMHKGHHEDTRDPSDCIIRSTSASPDATLLTLLGSIGIVPAVHSLVLDPLVVRRAPEPPSRPLTLSRIPDAPPPRS
jgi:hypothetical protein